MANLIDVEAAIERARKSDEIVGSSIWETSEVVMFLEDEPTVDAVEVVHGHWIERELPTKHLVCTACCQKNFMRIWSNYCPNCGAKMDGGN